MAQCTASKANGQRCLQNVAVEGAKCVFHDPARAEAAQAKGRETAAAKRREANVRTVSADEAPPNPETIAECAAYASWALGAVTTGVIDARTAREITGLLGRIQSALKESKTVDEIAELRADMAELQRARVGVVR